VIDIFNFRDGISLRATGYLPSYIDELMDKELLKLEFLYGNDEGENEKDKPAPNSSPSEVGAE